MCQPTINGQLCIQKNNIEIKFNTIQTQDNIHWTDLTLSSSDNTTQRQDNLWKHTCFELFVAYSDTNAYREFNFAPNGCWNSYDFKKYRQQQQNAEISPPQIKYTKLGPDQHTVSVNLALQDIALNNNPSIQKTLQLSITTVIQYSDLSYDYYALTHCGQAPDFHLRDSFIMDISVQQ
ncbi:hypothetical protein MNBD_GAMMA12-342 [hydrothermal vent metagenome]|uniref:Uncharacterized protein n=1 Tax=hydrothermal vent metagenome TaxID=652676 RepID=A0A3B0Y5T0_9ZZZZ